MDQSPAQPPNQGGDYASRFRKPGDPAPDAAKGPQEPAPPRPQGLVQMLEDTLTAPFQLGALFSVVARQPPPGYGVMTANLAAYWAAFFGVNLLHVAITNPKALEAVATRSPVAMGLAGAGALVAVTLGSFVGAAVLHAAVSVAGGQGDYRRSYQVLSLISLTAPLQALMNWAPFLWPLPVVAGTYMAVLACEHLHKAPPLRARAVFGALMFAALGVQWFARVQVERVAERYRALQQSAEILNQVGRQLQAGGGAAGPGLLAPPSGQPDQGRVASGLDLLASPSFQGGAQMSPAQAKQIAQAGAGIMKAVNPILNDPNLTKGMSPEQARQTREAVKLIGEMQSNLMTGKPMTAAEREKMMRKVMKMQQQMMEMSIQQNRRQAAKEGQE